jgi:hypothetical protein
VVHNLTTTTPEPTTTTPEQCCFSDVVVIIDTSGSIKETPSGNAMPEVRQFTNDLFAALPMGNCVCTGFIEFANVQNVLWALGDPQSCVASDPSNLPGQMLRIPNGQTNTWLALDEANAQLTGAAARAGACKKVGILTDGGSDNKELTRLAAEALHAAGVDICVLNVGEWREARENEGRAMTNDGSNGEQLGLNPGISFVQFDELAPGNWAQQMADCLCNGCYQAAP